MAVDDGEFLRTDRRAPIAAVAVVLPDRVEAVAIGSVTVDGEDATERLIALVRAVGPLDGVRAILLDGCVLGGFNVVDLVRLGRELGLPVVAVTRRRPDFVRIRAALRKWFPDDHAARWRRLRQRPLFAVPTAGPSIYACVTGCRRADAIALVHRAATRGFWPEPLRLAHLIASASTRARAGGAAGARGPRPTPTPNEPRIKGPRRRVGAGPVA